MTRTTGGWILIISLLSLALSMIGPALRADPQWEAGEGWKITGADSLTVSTASDSYAWNTSARPGSGWFISAKIRIGKSVGDVGAARLVLGDAARRPLIMVSVEKHNLGVSLAAVDVSDGTFRRVLTSGWMPGGDTEYTLTATCDENGVRVGLRGNCGLGYYETTPPVAASIMSSLSSLGVGSHACQVEFSNVRLQHSAHSALIGPQRTRVSPPAVLPKGSGRYSAQAKAAMSDLIRNYWTGTPDGGCIAPTYNGYRPAVPSLPRGGMWERGMMILCMDTFYRSTRDPVLRKRIASEWRRIKKLYTADELEAAGGSIHPACDDSGWDAMLYMVFYRDLGDRYALNRAKGLIDKAFKRWMDDQIGGGMWYDNAHSCKSLYQVAVVLTALRIWEATHDKSFRDRATVCYEWMESRLLRPDGLYWCDYKADGPVGKERPDDIHEAGSVTWLGGNMAMGVLHAWMFRTTGDKKYLQRAIRTADAIANKLTKNGVLICERDCWVNATFAGDWARSVLTLPGIDRKHKDLLLRTADSIYKSARTPDGYYGGCWRGPADGPGSPWSMIGSRPQQIMTSANSGCVIMAAALLCNTAHGDALHILQHDHGHDRSSADVR